MQRLEALVEEARAGESELERQLVICNACRYCEGFCAVFPAMMRRLEFGRGDLHYLANLCHNCGACLHSCQYAPPHEFQVNIPRAMAKVRVSTYAEYAWPQALGKLYGHAGATVAAALAAGLALFLVLALRLRGSLVHPPLAGNFYAVFPHNTLAILFGATFGFSILALAIGVRRFWRSVTPAQFLGHASAASVGEAADSAFRLKHLDGGHGEGCNEESDRYTLARRRFHHFTFYGFMLCFASTCVATFYHYALGRPAPYPMMSLPVVLTCSLPAR